MNNSTEISSAKLKRLHKVNNYIKSIFTPEKNGRRFLAVPKFCNSSVCDILTPQVVPDVLYFICHLCIILYKGTGMHSRNSLTLQA